MDNLKILDCSLRDGGYYNRWDFSEKFIDNYIKNISNLPFDFVEIGYVSVNGNEYFGQIRYIDKHLIEKCKVLGIKVAVMIDVKSIDNNLIAKINSIKNDVDLFRFAVNYELIDESLNKIFKLKLPKEKIAINLMYLSRWMNNKDFLNKILNIEKVKYLYLVDSYGSVFPDDVAKVFKFLSSNIKDIILGFHPHNNLELAFANTLQSIKYGATIIDSTFYGMGRGAGNLKSEIILTYLNQKYQLDIDFDSLDTLNKSFIKLHEKYKWGVDYPFILSGFLDFPQKEILYHIDQRYLSLKSLVSIISKKNNQLIFGKNFSQIQLNKNEKYLLIGGGDSIEKHKNRIIRWLKEKPKINLVFVSSKYSYIFKDVRNKKIFCLHGREAKRVKYKENSMFLVSPNSNSNETQLIHSDQTFTYPKNKILFKNSMFEASLIMLADQKINMTYAVGFDGYRNPNKNPKLKFLFAENQQILKTYFKKIKIISLTPTIYDHIEKSSIYDK